MSVTIRYSSTQCFGPNKMAIGNAIKHFVRHPLEALGLAAFFGLFRMLPLDMASAFGGFLGRQIGPRLPVNRVAVTNLRLVFPDKTDSELAEIVKEMWDNLGRNVAEFPHLAQIVSPSSGRVEIINGSMLISLIGSSEPAILAGAHLANWEISSALAHLSHRNIFSIVRKLNNPLAQRMVDHFRNSAGSRQIPKGRQGARKSLKALQRGEVVGLLFDQKMNDGVELKLLGHNAMTPIAPAQMAIRARCPLIPIRVERLTGARFRITIYPPVKMPQSDNLHAVAEAIMSTLNNQLDGWISEKPAQWMWIHRRWPNETYLNTSEQRID